MQAYAAADGLACHNLIMLLAYCYSAGLVAADCMYRYDTAYIQPLLLSLSLSQSWSVP